MHPYLKDKLVMSAGHVDTNSLHSLFQHILDFFPQKALFLATALNKSAQLSSISRPGSETTVETYNFVIYISYDMTGQIDLWFNYKGASRSNNKMVI